MTNSTPHLYPGGIKVALQIENDLYNTLDAKYRDRVPAPPAGTAALNATALVVRDGETNALHETPVSPGFVDLINHIAHAKAIDRIEPGYFDQYMFGLARETAIGHLPQAPDITEDRYWTDQVMSDQASYFNQMAGMICALNYSHQYLGHCTKYANVICSPQGDVTSINNFLTQREWKESLRAAALNSLQCALSTEGIQVLFDAINRMPQRPDWTGFIMPQGIDVRSTNQQLSRWEEDFFHGKFQ